MCPKGSLGGVSVRGASPGTRETDVLHPLNRIDEVNAIMLSGGSAYGLAAADGAMTYLEEQGIGVKVGEGVVPIVPAAILYDLGIGDGTIRPISDNGYSACKLASSDPVEQGCVGAGTGATVAKTLGHQKAIKGGLGSASVDLGGGLVVGALVVVNAIGSVYDPENGSLIAGPRVGEIMSDSMTDLISGNLFPIYEISLHFLHNLILLLDIYYNPQSIRFHFEIEFKSFNKKPHECGVFLTLNNKRKTISVITSS